MKLNDEEEVELGQSVDVEWRELDQEGLTVELARVFYMVCREFDRRFGGAEDVPVWEELDDIRRQHVMATAGTMMWEGTTTRELHKIVQEGYKGLGWKFGPKHDPEKKETPGLTDYDNLGMIQHLRDDVITALIMALKVFLRIE